jgi:hypothetical protein
VRHHAVTAVTAVTELAEVPKCLVIGRALVNASGELLYRHEVSIAGQGGLVVSHDFSGGMWYGVRDVH